MFIRKKHVKHDRLLKDFSFNHLLNTLITLLSFFQKIFFPKSLFYNLSRHYKKNSINSKQKNSNNKIETYWICYKNFKKTHSRPFFGLFALKPPKQDFFQNNFTHFSVLMLLQLNAKKSGTFNLLYY